MSGASIFGYVVLGTGSLVFMRWCWVSFTNWLDSYVANAVGDRREQPRQQVTDTDDMACAFGEVAAYPPNARCPVDFDEGRRAAISVAGEGADGAARRSIQVTQHSHFSPDIARLERPL